MGGLFGGGGGGGQQLAAAQAQSAASVESTRIAAEVARENIEFQREGLGVVREGIDIAREGVVLSREDAEFQRSQYQDWKDVYGDLQTNIGEYYEALGPERIISQGLEAEQKEFQSTRANITKSLAQRGLSGSGIEAEAITQLENQRYVGRANVRATAEQRVVEQKQGFLGIGLGQGANYLGTLAQTTGQTQTAYGNVNTAFGRVGSTYGNVGTAYGQQVGAFTNQAQNQANISGSYLQSYNQAQQRESSLFGDILGVGAGLLFG
jgi:hypothetical protein